MDIRVHLHLPFTRVIVLFAGLANASNGTNRK
jgi:hypothetical protein